MIFAYTIDKVIHGKKWQTRRLVKQDEQFERDRQRVIKMNMRIVYEVGKSYAVQPNRGKKSIARILLTGIRCERVEKINEEDAVAEGFPSRDAFINTWYSIHGKAANLKTFVWVLEFELCAIAAQELKELYDERHAKNRSPYYGNDVSSAIQGVSGTGLHSRDNKDWRMDTFVSNQLPLSVAR